MKCSNCLEEIGPKYKYALSENVCPICGEKILHDELHKFRTQVMYALERETNLEEKADEIVEIIKRKMGKEATPIRKITKMPDEIRKQGIREDDETGQTVGQEVVEGEETSYDPNDPDDPNNPENKEFLKDVVFTAGSSETKKKANLKKPIPRPISRV